MFEFQSRLFSETRSDSTSVLVTTQCLRLQRGHKDTQQKHS